MFLHYKSTDHIVDDGKNGENADREPESGLRSLGNGFAYLLEALMSISDTNREPSFRNVHDDHGYNNLL